jgi:hypothetical protein
MGVISAMGSASMGFTPVIESAVGFATMDAAGRFSMTWAN